MKHFKLYLTEQQLKTIAEICENKEELSFVTDEVNLTLAGGISEIVKEWENDDFK